MARRPPLRYRLDSYPPIPGDSEVGAAWREFLCGGRVICPWFGRDLGALVLDAADPRGIWFEKESKLADEIGQPTR